MAKDNTIAQEVAKCLAMIDVKGTEQTRQEACKSVESDACKWTVQISLSWGMYTLLSPSSEPMNLLF